MSAPPPPTPEQIDTLAALQKVQQTKTIFRFLLVAFVIFSIILLLSLFWVPCDGWSSWTGWSVRFVLATINSVVGISFRTVVRSLYPITR